MINRSRRSRGLAEANFFILLTVGLVALAVVAAFSIRGVSALRTQSSAVPCGCEPVVAAAAWPAGPSILVGLGFVYVAAVLVRLMVVSIRMRRIMMAVEPLPTSSRLSGLADRLGLGYSVVEIGSTGSDAFCAGWWAPKMYVSRATATDLKDDELMAVLAHEQYHLRRRDPLRLLLVDALMFPWRLIPGTRSLEREWRSAVELAADEYAVARTGEQTGLGSALLKMIRPEIASASIPGFSGVTNRRIDQLLGRVSWIGQVRLLVLSTLLAGALIVIAGTANARVTSFETNVGSMSVGQCREQQARSCVAPPQLTPMPAAGVTFVSVP
ncbi:MAG: M56 family metallopeptidase [Candidatus Kerfeldbacteria bacterium]|nr:M56 family metallopeptidase [Candidatus Kerfeldbacteria bacterium]